MVRALFFSLADRNEAGFGGKSRNFSAVKVALELNER